MGRVIALVFAFLIVTAAAADERDRAEWNPPARYDHPFRGELIEHRLPPEHVVVECARVFAHFGLSLKPGAGRRGCAFHNADRSKCTIIYIDRPYGLATPEAVRRHEIGHCNGWPSHHPG